MPEKKQVLYDLRTSYNGPFVVEDFYAEVDDWIRQNGLEKEHKKKLEHITKNGKRIEWVIEAHEHLDNLNHGIVRLWALFDNVKEVVIKKEGKKVRINNGEVMITIDGFLQTHLRASIYQTKPVYYFIRGVIDRFIYNWSEKYDGKVNSQGRDLFKRIRSFFELQSYKYQ